MNLQLLLSPFAVADVQQRRAPMGDGPQFVVNHAALEMDPARHAGLDPERHLTGLACACLQNLLTIPVERALVTRRNKLRE